MVIVSKQCLESSADRPEEKLIGGGEIGTEGEESIRVLEGYRETRPGDQVGAGFELDGGDVFCAEGAIAQDLDAEWAAEEVDVKGGRRRWGKGENEDAVFAARDVEIVVVEGE